MDYKNVSNQLNESGDLPKANNQLFAIQQKLNALSNGIDSPIKNYLKSNLNDSISFRPLNSLFLNTSNDNILYKVIQSDPLDSIDKIVTFPNQYKNSVN
ncbi:hypothetical protein FACS189459_7320 [Bacilli bacterium]|nr:hypothetical protein FACS189459_7320 [Bacilli bacterium]